MNNTNYDSNYNEIFENNSLKLDRQTLDIDKWDIYLSNELSSTMDYKDRNNKLFDNALINSIGQSTELLSMANFNILQSSPRSLPSSYDHFFWTSAINWELTSTRKISIKVKKIKSVCQVINTQFNLKIRPWQVGIVTDITKRKTNICAIAGINTGKSLIYQSIPRVTKGSVVVISPIIAFIKDKLGIGPDILCIYHLHLIL